MIRASWIQWLQAPPITGRAALLCAIAAVATPTIVRAAIDGVVTGCEFTPYLPFVLLSAILLGWRQAGTVALASVAILGGLFSGPLNAVPTPCFLSGAGIFLAASAMIIGVVVVIRQVAGGIQRRGADEAVGGIVFSLDQGQVWASWYGEGPPVNLGSQGKVSEMMEDFLAQVEVGKRLTRRSS
jgi:hypothetical protein